MGSPLKKLKEFKANLPSVGDLKEMQDIGRNTSKQVEVQVKEILKQTVLMERWALAAEAQVEYLDRITTALEKIAEK